MEKMPRLTENSEKMERNLREQMDVRLLFAEAIQKRNQAPLKDILLKQTDLHGRLFSVLASQEIDPKWESIAAEIEAASTHNEKIDVMARHYLQEVVTHRDHREGAFWPFRYGYNEKRNAIELHFGTMRLNVYEPEAQGLLRQELLDIQKGKLREMFTRIKSKYTQPGLIVRGASWLYGREAYRRLYPPSYTEHMEVRRSDEFIGGGTWGQFQTATGEVNQEYKKKFLENLEHLDLGRLSDAFPCPTYLVSAPIEDFYAFYGIE